MTYNFDPDRWYAMEKDAIETARLEGRIDTAAAEEALADLERRYGEMLDRLDGTFRIHPE
jgi:hypothetical protein